MKTLKKITMPKIVFIFVILFLASCAATTIPEISFESKRYKNGTETRGLWYRGAYDFS